MKVKLISRTQPVDLYPIESSEHLVSYCARVSNPKNQDNIKTADKLLQYCARHGHWSVFEMADMTLEITTSRAIAQQILRHRSFSFQEFSQRYAECTKFEFIEARRQDPKNRQNSTDDVSDEDYAWFQSCIKEIEELAVLYYSQAIDRGIAKEQARFMLPHHTQTTLYMKGSVRSWIHYCQVRCDPSTQKEHRYVAEECREILLEQFPSVKNIFKKT